MPGDPELPQPARFWTVEEANARLDGLRQLLTELKGWSGRLATLAEELQRLAAFWGPELDAHDHPDRALKERIASEAGLLRRRIETAVHALHEEGIEIKEIDRGLLDFFALQDGEVVLLCWERGETEVGFFHSLEAGYRGRRPIPDRFRQAAPRPAGRR